MTLRELKVGKSAKILTVGGEGSLRQHFLDMGVIPGERVTVVKLAPLGDPMELMIHGYELTLRLADAEKIQIEELTGFEQTTEKVLPVKRAEHPGLGEGGRYHSKTHENPLPANELLTYALVGNQNSGKTTLFNRLTGSNQHVGNFPGVTVDKKDGPIIGQNNTLVTDLPGIYSMSPYSREEIVSRNFVLNERPKAIINIVDATNIERNLYLTMQLLEIGIPMVVALNMMDEVTQNSGSIDINIMESMLGVPVVPISAAKNQGINELIKHAIHIAHYQEKPARQDFCDEHDNNGAVHRSLHAVIHLIEDHALAAEIPVRFAASKLLEGDKLILEQLRLTQNEKEMLEHIVLQLEEERGLDRSAAIADMRYHFIRTVCDAAVIKPKESREHERSRWLDEFLTGRFTAIPAFLLIISAVFYLTFNVVGAFLQDELAYLIKIITEWADAGLVSVGINPVLHRLIIEGIFAGVGSVVSFLPIIVTMFFFLSMLEDSGYIARVAFFMDKVLRKIGLSGRSIVPMLLGFGCTVPAVMATRILPSERDRRLTILLTPFMSCSAKLPIYAFFVAAFFPEDGGMVMTALYLSGISLAVMLALFFKKFVFRGEAVPFVMELPNYRLPSMRNVARLLWEKAYDFLSRAFSVIMAATVVVWVLQSFDIHFNLVTDSQNSIMAMLAGVLVPLFDPVGLGDWRICTSLISGFLAKENVVSTIGVLFDADGGVRTAMNGLSAASMLVFSLLYTPCMAAVAAIKRELGTQWALGVIGWQCVVAWLAAFLVYNFC